MAIFNLRHRLAALSAWALALALAFGAALPQPAQAIGPETGGYAQMHRPTLSSQMQNMGRSMGSQRSFFGSPDRERFASCPFSKHCGILHPKSAAKRGKKSKAEKVGAATGELIGAVAGGTAGGMAGSAAGPATGIAGSIAGSWIGGKAGGAGGGAIGRAYHGRDGHHR